LATPAPKRQPDRGAQRLFHFNTNRHTDLWLMLGDNAYNVGSDTEYQGAVFNMYPTMLRKSVLFSTLGNHETAQATAYVDTYPYFSIFTLPTAGEGGGVPSGTEHFYSFDFGDIHFRLPGFDDGRSRHKRNHGELAARDLASTLATWIVAFWHHPPYTKGSHNSTRERTHSDAQKGLIPFSNRTALIWC
jgi:hypothetical protein